MTPSLRLAEQAPKTTESEKRRKKREISLLCHESQRCRPLALTQIFLLSFVQRIYWSSCFFFFSFSLFSSFLSVSLSLSISLCVWLLREPAPPHLLNPFHSLFHASFCVLHPPPVFFLLLHHYQFLSQSPHGRSPKESSIWWVEGESLH